MRIRELNESLDIVTVNKRLNPKIWDGNELKPEVREKLMDIARVFKEFIGIDITVVDITVTGSNANYTWTEYSDLDLHLIVPGLPTESERELYTAKKALWAEQHNITIKGLPVECYVQGDEETHHSTGVYSIAKNQWLTEPKKIKPDVDDAAVTAKKDSLVHDIETALLSKDIEKLRAVKERITKMRKSGLARAGEWSVENLVFKLLRNLGFIDKITDLIRELEDQELSLEHQQNTLD
jgi:predicted nucleotidyltransferase